MKTLLKIFFTTLMIASLGCYTSFKSLNKNPRKWQNQTVRIQGWVTSVYPADNFYNLIILRNKTGKYFVAVIKQMPEPKFGKKIQVTGKFYPGKAIGLNIPVIIDSSQFMFHLSNPTDPKTIHIYGRNFPKKFSVPLMPRFILPKTCPEFTIQNNSKQ